MSTTASAIEFMHAGKRDLLLLRRAGHETNDLERKACVYVPSLSTSSLPSSHAACLNFSEPFSKEVTKQKTMTLHIMLQGKISAGAKGHGAGGFTVTWLTLSCSQNCCPDYTNPVKGQPFLHMSTADTSSLNASPLKNLKAESLFTRHHASHQHFLNPLPSLTNIEFLLPTVALLSMHRHQKPQYKPITSVWSTGASDTAPQS